ncbi:serine/threonine-protein kinase GCN2 [Sporobolomyces salmoneus]|uniref:serine/threonine-protein kinase GCN2 n=1 Tax=Sporobolomyces salmoneus TaxID=183962 RepID=UPI003176D32B
MEDFSELQDGELEVLQSIFMDDFEKVASKTAWKAVTAVHEFRICVRPVEEDLKEKVKVWVRFKLPQKYPKVPPTMTFEDSQGLASTHLSELATVLHQHATSLLGTEMIYELCTQAATFITDRHLDSARGKQASFQDQRRKREEEQTKAAEEAKLKAKEREEQQEAEEAARLSQLISEDVRKKEELRIERERRERELDHAASVALELEPGGDRRCVVKVRQVTGGSKEDATVKFGLIADGDWLSLTVSAQVDMANQPPRPATAYIYELLAPYFLTSQGRRKVGKLEVDLERTNSIQHPNVLTPLGFRLVPHTPGFFPTNPHSKPVSRSGEGWSLIVLSSLVLSSHTQSLEDLLSAVGDLRVDRAIRYFSHLVSAVECLHSNHVVHRAIRPKVVFITSEKARAKETGDGASGGVRLGGAGWYRRLIDLNKAEPWLIQPSDEDPPDSWTCPEAITAPFDYDKARDMYDLGLVFAQMVFGLDVVHRYSSPADLVRSIPRNYPPLVRKILVDLLLAEPKKRPHASRLSAQLAENSNSGTTLHPLQLSTTPPNPLNAWHQTRNPHGDGLATPVLSPPPPLDKHPSRPPDQPLSRSVDGPSGFFWQPKVSGSRYRSEFEELEFLGRGGGGQVVKARNRLDGHLYAVKKIRLPDDRASEIKILREVTIWSRMNHPNIVRYHTSWTEVDEAFGSFPEGEGASQSGTGTGTGFTSELGTTDSSTQESEETESSTEQESDSDSSSDSVVDFDEDSSPGAELDMDFGDDLDDIDFLSVGHAQSRSVSYPSIHFGNEDDPSRPGSSNGTSPKNPSKKSTRASTPNQPVATPTPPKQRRTLYIQMEYVEKLTLREAIEDGITEVDSWRLLFQILSAMLHFTSLNIIHRDLKPSNIFIDVKGDVRIGDFGLAVNQGGGDQTDGLLSVETSQDESDLTSGVGTSLYIAPETLTPSRQDRGVKRAPSNKIDMYSLGIVFFEMWHKFSTGMERIQVLHDLRRPEIKFPSSWDAVKLARHTKIVQACLTHDPEVRPSPKDLLASDLLPPRVGDDSIQETIRLLSHSGTTHAQSLITALFNQSDEDRLRKDFSYDFYDGEGAKVDNDPYLQLVHDKLSHIFRQKGAIRMDSPLLMPTSQVYASRKPVRLLDSDGTIVCLPFHLNITFCRMVARDSTFIRLKRWTIAPVYRTSAAGGQPRAILNAAFDIVSDVAMPAMEAECIFVLEEILSAFPFSGQIWHVLNHSKILDALLDVFPVKQRTQVAELLVQHSRSQRTWTKTSTELLKLPGVTKAMCDILRAVDVSGDLAKVRSLVLSSTSRLKHVAKEGFEELSDIITLCHQLGIKNIKVSPLLASNYDFHKDGSIFESHVLRGKTRDVIAAGGRFDEVVSRLAAPEVRFSGRCPHVVGFSLSVAKLSAAAADAHQVSLKRNPKESFGPFAIRRADVYVVSFVPGLIDLRLEIVKELWVAGIKADLMYDTNVFNVAPEQLMVAARREGILWLVIVKPGAGRLPGEDVEKSIKVKSVLRGYEVEVPRAELDTWLIQSMREQSAVDEAVGGGFNDSATEPSTALPEPPRPNQDFFPILPDEDVRQKGRHNKRSMIAHRAQKNLEQATKAAAKAPVFAIDIDGPAFEKLANSPTWVTSDEAFKQVLHTAPHGKRDYYLNIRQAIQNKRNRTNPPIDRFWLYSLRDDRSVLMSFFENV